MRYLKIALLATLVAAIGLMTACLTEDSFTDQYIEKSCALSLECFDTATLEFMGWTTEQDCVDAMSGDDDDSAGEECDFDAGIGQDCLNLLDEADCDTFLDPTADHVSTCGDVCG